MITTGTTLYSNLKKHWGKLSTLEQAGLALKLACDARYDELTNKQQALFEKVADSGQGWASEQELEEMRAEFLRHHF